MLDTEGVRAPNLRHMENAVLHDNRLAVYAVWLADATLVLLDGTHMTDSAEILSLVKYISDRSTGALGRLTNRLFFAMRSISIAQGSLNVDLPHPHFTNRGRKKMSKRQRKKERTEQDDDHNDDDDDGHEGGFGSLFGFLLVHS